MVNVLGVLKGQAIFFDTIAVEVATAEVLASLGAFLDQILHKSNSPFSAQRPRSGLLALLPWSEKWSFGSGREIFHLSGSRRRSGGLLAEVRKQCAFASKRSTLPPHCCSH